MKVLRQFNVGIVRYRPNQEFIPTTDFDAKKLQGLIDQGYLEGQPPKAPKTTPKTDKTEVSK